MPERGFGCRDARVLGCLGDWMGALGTLWPDIVLRPSRHGQGSEEMAQGRWFQVGDPLP